MAKIPPDERSVYLAFKHVFNGPDTQPQNDKAIRKKIRKYESENEEIQALIQEHNVKPLGNAIKALLEGDIFASTLRAKIRFPELFDVSPAQNAERALSEAEAAKAEADAIREVTVEQHDGSISTTLDGETAATKEEKGKQPSKSPKRDSKK